MEHIVRLDCAPAHTVHPLWRNHARHTARLSPLTRWDTLPLAGLAALEAEERLEHGIRTVETKISARLRCLPPPFAHRLAFRLTTATGRTYLLGGVAYPHPLATLTDTRPDTPDGRATHTLTISANTPLYQLV